MNRPLRTITVQALIDLLSDEDPEALVIFTADYGDRGNTEQALPLKGETDTVTIRESAYSNSGYAIAEDEDADQTYVVIR